MNTLDRVARPLQAARTFKPITADASGTVPERIEILKAGMWPDGSAKGHLDITIPNLVEMVSNFDRGVGMPGGAGTGLPIDYGHEEWAQAAGWMKSLELIGDTLYAHVEWSTSGLAALQGKEYKCISPSFWPGCLGQWQDPENPDITASNVLVGAGLTNIPFFKGLTPIMASTGSNNVMYISANNKETSTVPTLDEVRIKDATSLTDEEKQVLADNKADLSADELSKFNLTEAVDKAIENKEVEKVEEVTETEEVKEAVAIAASVKSGEKMVVNASEFTSLKGQVEASAKKLAEYELKDTAAFVTAHIARGAIKADQATEWTKRIVADNSMKDLLTSLPDNKVLAAEMGDSSTENTISAYAQLKEKAEKIVADRKVSYGDAITAARRENPELVKAADDETKTV